MSVQAIDRYSNRIVITTEANARKQRDRYKILAYVIN